MNVNQIPEYVKIGKGTYLGEINFFRWGDEPITIGKFCSISSLTKILAGGGHHIDTVSAYPFDTMLMGNQGGFKEERSYINGGTGIHVGNDVWMGFGATIIGNVNVGHGAVIAANATVMTDIPPYAIVVGNPARVTKFRFREEIVDALLGIAWWDWPMDVIKSRVDDFFLPVEQFVAKYRDYPQSKEAV